MRPIDLLIIVAYLASILGIGFWCRKRQKTTRHYFLAGRQIPWWAISGSIVATETSAITFVSVPGLAYAQGGNFTFLQLALGYILGRIVICILFIPAYFRHTLLTIYELLQTRFGWPVKSLAASLFIIMRTIADGVRLLLTSVVMAVVWQTFLPSMPALHATAISIALIGCVMLLFTTVGGMEAVVWTEVLHVGVYIAGAIAAGILLVRAIPGGLQGAIAVGAQFHKFRLFDFSFDLTRAYTFWAGVIGGCFLNMSTHGTDQYMVQRYLCTTSARKASLALLVSGVVIFVQFAGFLFLGTLLFDFYRPDRSGYMLPDRIFPDFIIHHTPSGLSGLITAAVLAAATSPSVNSVAATALRDLYQPLIRERSDEHYLGVSRLLTVVAGTAQIVVALALIGDKGSAINTALGVASLINGPILGVFLLSALQREGSTAAFTAMLSGIAAVTAVWIWTPVAWPWYAVVGSMTTLAVGIVLARKASRKELTVNG